MYDVRKNSSHYFSPPLAATNSTNFVDNFFPAAFKHLAPLPSWGKK
jgi:hypothetical protein